ncbi:HNH endonuclease signature motif containing protein [Amycolatopsis sp. EV170708-02-1]|uniref:HNH endonuclease signature motif containing protein n=1 Tax=Amycolatopsis sp. EV170708-02-1 TaxID=2919322 RepID=UPI001F0C7BFB|nr:HNH endonuclease signature motif containing protein [Amycolatopsis sp. EV170708-02-1]UMP00277.1 HNH endonuclease [Amycolatopsis sp. EV170708-02-1]
MTQSLAFNPKAAQFLDAAYDEEVVLRRAQGRQVHAIAGFAAVGGSRRSVTEEVALAFSVSRNQAYLLVETSCALVARLPNTLAALEKGDIDLYKASKVSQLTREVSDEVAALVDAFMTKRLADRDPTAIRKSVDHAVQKFDPDGYRERAEQKRALRHVSLDHEDETMSKLTGYLPAEVASSVYASLSRAAKARRRSDKSRTLDQHRADIFAERLLAEDGHGTPRAHIHVYVDLLTLAGAREDPATLAGYGPIPGWLTREIAVDPGSTWSRLITDPTTGQLLEAGPGTYRPPASLARLIKARDRECTHPGCHRPAEFSEIDHTTTWARHGHTDHHNCHAACTIHNMLKEEPGWHAEPTGNGGMTITTPTGRTYTAAPEPLHDPRPHPEDDDTPPF